MGDPRRFLNWRIGRVDEWTVRARLIEGALPRSTAVDDSASLKRWVKLEAYRGDLFARLGEAFFELQFVRRSEQRSVCRQLTSWSRPFVSCLAISGTGPSLEGTLIVMRTALPGILKEAPSLVLPHELLEGIEESKRPRLSDIADEIVLPSADGPTMVVTTPVLIGAAATSGTARVTIHLHRRWRLDCDVVGDFGAQYLLVQAIEDSGGVTFVRDGRLIATARAPRVVANVAEIQGTDLGALTPRRHEVIEAWIAYEQLAQDQRLRSVEERRDHHLEYTEVESVSAGNDPEFQVVLASPEVAQEHWIAPQVAGRKKRVRVRAAIEVVDLDQRLDPMRGEVVRFDDGGNGRLDARIKLRGSGRVPPVRGRLVAIEDEGDTRQRERRKRALDRLRSGTCANPELLGWLMNPASVPDPDAGRRAGASLVGLDEYQRRAVALATRVPSIVLVLGPPGAGKTTVIRAIVEEFRKRVAREKSSPDAPAPFRVLVTSIQNEAVDNVAEKVGAAAGIEIWHIGDKAAREARSFRLQTDAKRIAAEIWRELRDMPRFVAYERFHHLRTSIGLMRHALFEVGLGSEYADRLRALASADERKALTPLLDAQLTRLLGQLDQALAGAVHANTTQDDGQRGPLGLVLTRLVDTPTELTRESWALLSKDLDNVYAALAKPEPIDRPLYELGERWNDLRRRLRREAKYDFSVESARALTALRDETRAVVSASTVAPVPHKPVRELDEALVSEAHGWLQRAANLVDAEMSQRAHQEEAVLYRWVHTLAEEPIRLERIVENHAMVTTATCQRVDQKRGNQDATEFDVVIVDEAARAGIDVLVPMSLGKSIVLVGDHRQLPPYVDREVAEQLEEGIREQVDLNRDSLFSWLWKRLPQSNIVSLSRQYRMHEDIGRAVSALFYEPELALSHHFSEERSELRRPDFGLCANQPLVWLDTSDVLHDPVARAERRIKWPCKEENDYEGDVIIRLLRQIKREPLASWRVREGKPPVGVISFYGDQIALIERRLEQDIDADLRSLIQVGSVDSFQGREFPLIILSTVRSNRDGFVGFLRLPNRINVAMSRAQRQLIIVGDSSTLAANNDGGIPELRKLFTDLRAERLRGLVQRSAEVGQ